MGDRLVGAKVAFLTANEGVEQVELTVPRDALREEGAETFLLAPKAGPVQAFNHLTAADVFVADISVEDAEVADYDALVLPGGVANPDQLRLVPAAVHFVRECWSAGIPVAAICHAPWMLADAGLTEGRRMTSYPSLRTDLRRAGADWADEELVVDDGIITSRKPDDLPAFTEAVITAVANARAGAA